ncbi:hypothetical protein [Actinomadura montaniterrae]|uniref:Uncharacterized protein n=1 Tax=Actinomadura montaniterrae TaxID=1803903 RepID=A0A6L3VXN3_9ACTN|nr:hypothetical protein [Actinomadura montaniterrae]KAB2385941.1 hypothetical protein F9B16_09065 [Actinomadura montaniterrae]
MTIPDGPLADLWATFLELTRKVETEALDLDDALRELRLHEVVDTAGRTWRVDPMTQSFIRRGPEDGAAWRPAAPSEFTQGAEPEAAGRSRQGAGVDTLLLPPTLQHGTQASEGGGSLLPGIALEEEWDRTRRSAKNRRSMLLAIGAGAAGLILLLLIAVATQGPGHRTGTQAQSGATRSQTPSQAPQAPVVPQSAKPYSVPPSGRCLSVLTEISSGDMNRIARVAERSQYNYNNQRLHAAIYSGWAGAGLTIDPKSAVGDPSGTSATQQWELHDGTTVIAVATVTWQRSGPASPWLLAKWPEFLPTS